MGLLRQGYQDPRRRDLAVQRRRRQGREGHGQEQDRRSTLLLHRLQVRRARVHAAHADLGLPALPDALSDHLRLHELQPRHQATLSRREPRGRADVRGQLGSARTRTRAHGAPQVQDRRLHAALRQVQEGGA